MVEPPAPDLAARITAAIAATGMQKKAVAEALGVSAQAITGWQKTGRISKEKLIGLAALAGTTAEELLTGPVLSTGLPITAAQSVRLDPEIIVGAVRTLQIVFGRRGLTVDLADRDMAEIFAEAYAVYASMDDTPDAEIELTAQVIDFIQAREARNGGHTSGTARGTDRATGRRSRAV